MALAGTAAPVVEPAPAGEITRLLVDDPHTDVILLFLETLRDAPALADAARAAHRAGKSIAVFKLGRSEVGAQLAVSHTGALAGSDAACDAFFREHGIVRVQLLETLLEIAPLLVRAGGSRFAIPQVNLLELVRLEGERIRRGIEMIHGAPVYRLRGNLLPLVTLAHELGTAAAVTPGEAAPPEDVRARETVNIVVLQAGDRQFGLVVDGINDTEEIVVKPLGKQLKGTPCFAFTRMALSSAMRIASRNRARAPCIEPEASST